MEWRLPMENDSVLLTLDDAHLTDEALEGFCLGSLADEGDLATVEEHLLLCAYCQNRMEKAQSFVDAVKEAAKRLEEKPKVESSKPNLRLWLPLAMAAGLALFFVMPRGVDNGDVPVGRTLNSYRANAGIEAPAGRKLSLAPDTSGLPGTDSLRYELVEATGRQVTEDRLWNGKPILVESLKAGRYYLRLQDRSSGAQLREFSLDLR